MGGKEIIIRVNSGISVVSAFPTGKGAAVATDIPMKAVLEPSTSRGTFEDLIDHIHSRLGGNRNVNFRILSEIPQRQGMKSSSALVGSMLLAYCKFNSIELSREETLKAGSEISIDAGLSYTGATDDLAASIYGGLCICDNNSRSLERRLNVNRDPCIIIPGEPGQGSNSFGQNDFSWLKNVYDRMWKMVDRKTMSIIAVANGNYMGHMSGNHIPYSQLQGLNFNICGINGRGASMFFMYDSDRIMLRDASDMRKRGMNPLETHITNRGAQIHEKKY